MCSVMHMVTKPVYNYINAHRCCQLESAIPMVDIYDDVFGDINHTYSTIPDIDPTKVQQRYSEYIIPKCNIGLAHKGN